MKKLKSFKIMYLSLGVCLVSVAAIGFSNWILINEDSDEGFITAQIGAINDTKVTARITNKDDLNVRFDANDNTDGLITSGSDSESEKMAFSIELQVDKGALTSFNNLNVAFDFNNDDGGAKKFIETVASDPQYINATFLNKTYEITLNDISSESETTSEDGYFKYKFIISENVATITASFSFKWGTAFGEENPCNEKVSNTADVLDGFSKAFSKFKDSINAENQNSNIVLTVTPGIK